MSIDRLVTKHYTRGNLGSAILAALEAAGKDLDRLSVEDLAPVDEFHVRGRPATMELTKALAMAPGMRVLDIGCGIGGPSRYIAATYDCTVVGIDLTEEYCRTAAMLADRLGLGERVEYRPGNALAMPFVNAEFDVAYTQHVAMNIEDKTRLYAEVWRVLKPGARFGSTICCRARAARFSTRCPGRATTPRVFWCGRMSSDACSRTPASRS
jgi:SAM-dependent methyltransferase